MYELGYIDNPSHDYGYSNEYGYGYDCAYRLVGSMLIFILCPLIYVWIEIYWQTRGSYDYDYVNGLVGYMPKFLLLLSLGFGDIESLYRNGYGYK